jgi:hypothetical protein
MYSGVGQGEIVRDQGGMTRGTSLPLKLTLPFSESIS